MINFFRKKRKLLADENKAAKYARYAIGEILLVVVGILIALQINTWNQNRLSSVQESAILVSIHKEFNQNKKQLDSVVIQHKLAHSSCAKIIDLFPIKTKQEPSVLDSLSSYLWNSYGGVTFNPSQTSINALASTSSFDIIKNENLRDLLISWNDLIEDYQEEEQRSVEHIWDQYDPYMSKHFDWNFNFKDTRNKMDALQTLEFEFLVKSKHDFIDQILYSSGELKKVQETLDKIIELSEPKIND